MQRVYQVGALLCAVLFASVYIFAVAQEDTILSIEPSYFLPEGIVGDITEEVCTLSGGTETTCYRISVLSVPTEHDIGPWCPRNITDTAESAGIWFEDGVVYDLTGEFIQNLAIFYDDENWMLYNDDGSINVTDTIEAFEAAARPDVDPEYNNYCVEGQLEWLEEGATLLTYVVPITPVMQETPQNLTNDAIGISLNGVNFDPPAPVEDILAAYTIAAIDDCGGHINPVTGYHYHAHTDCTAQVDQPDGHAPLIGYALDGIGMYALHDEAGEPTEDLDDCGGHYDVARGYHYHVASAGSNMTLGCFTAEIGCVFNGEGIGEVCDASANNNGERPAREPRDDTQGDASNGQPDLALAAERLGVSEQALRDALGTPPPDFESAAEELGVSVEDLEAALGQP